MNRYSRRAFLRYVSSGLGGIAASTLLGSCQPTGPTNPAVETETSESTVSPSISPSRSNAARISTTSTTIEPTDTVVPSATPKPVDLVVAHGSDPEQNVYKAFEAFGGMKQFIPTGGKVVIKPNICVDYHTYEYAATTNPWVVGALVRLCLDAGAKKVEVLDFPFGGDSASAYAKSGIQEQVEAAGGTMHPISFLKFKQVELPEGQVLKNIAIYDEVLSADAFINVPIAKTHGLAKLTLGMKNLLGIIDNREEMHRWLGEKIADLLTVVKPTLTVVDATRILTANGPTGGNLDDVKKMDTVIISTDFVAADSYATGLFGMKPEDIQYIQAAFNRGYGVMDPSTLKMEELYLDG